jgi:hypothetical protein
VQFVRSKPVDISEKLSVMHKFPQLHRREVDVWMQNEKNGLKEPQLRETKAKMRKSRRQKLVQANRNRTRLITVPSIGDWRRMRMLYCFVIHACCCFCV